MKFIMSIDCGTFGRCMILIINLISKRYRKGNSGRYIQKPAGLNRIPAIFGKSALRLSRCYGKTVSEPGHRGCWNRKSTRNHYCLEQIYGRAVMNAIVWQCRRTVSGRKLELGIRKSLKPDLYSTLIFIYKT